MRILHFKVVLAAIFIKININNRKFRPYSKFYSLVNSKWVPLISDVFYDEKMCQKLLSGQPHMLQIVCSSVRVNLCYYVLLDII